MNVMCLARQPGAVSEGTIGKLAEALGFRNVDRAYVEKRLEEIGFGSERTRRFDEKKPSLAAAMSRDRDEYLHYLKLVLYDEATKGPCLVVGRGGFSVFSGVAGVLSVLVDAPFRKRVSATAKESALPERQAERLVHKNDQDRAGFHRFFFDVDWLDPSNYDLCVNSATFAPDALVGFLVAAAKLRADAAADQAGKARFAELLLGSRVIDEVVYAKNLPVHFAEAEVRGGQVTLRGVSNSQAAVDAALAAAHAVPGVTDVESTIQIVQDYQLLP